MRHFPLPVKKAIFYHSPHFLVYLSTVISSLRFSIMKLVPFRFFAFGRSWAWIWIVLCALAAGSSSHVFSADIDALRWKWSNPTPFGNSVAGLAWRTNRLYLSVGDQGSIYGAETLPTWRRLSTDTTLSLRAVTYFGDRAIIVGAAGVILWSDGDVFQTAVTGKTNWLEGIAASPDRLVVVGDAGLVLVSTNGINWVAGSSGTTNWLRSVAYGSGVFLAVGEQGWVGSSPDGRVWTQRATGRTTVALNSVVPSTTGFFAVGERGTYLSSRTASLSQWDSSRISTEYALNATVAVGSERVVVGNGECWFGVQIGTAFIWSNEVNSLRSAPAPVDNYLSLIATGTVLLAGSDNGLIVSGTRSSSVAGYSWSYTEPTTLSTLWDSLLVLVARTNTTVAAPSGIPVFSTNQTPSEFVLAVGQRSAFVDSTDGIIWDQGLVSTRFSSIDFYGIGGRSNLLIAAGAKGTLAKSTSEFLPIVTTNLFTNGAVVLRVLLTNQVNSLGITWDPVTSPVTADLQSVAASEELIVVTGTAGTVITSPDAATWTRRTSGTTATLSSVGHWAGGFVATGERGVLLTSSNGIRWNVLPPTTTNWLWRVRSIEGRLLVVGENGTLLISTNATSWQSQRVGQTTWWNDVVHAWDKWYLIGNSGTVAVSTNLISWTLASAPTSRDLYTATVIGKRIIAGGENGVILRARVAPFEAPVKLAKYPKSAVDNFFVFSGEQDQPFVFERSIDLQDWMHPDLLEITDVEGLLFLFDSEPNGLTQQFYQTRSP